MAHETLIKFGYPGTLLHQGRHWALLARPAQVTLGSLVLCSTSDVRAYSDLSVEAFSEQRDMVVLAERMLREFVRYERINYLMLMMVDPHVHFHVLPRYEGARNHNGLNLSDSGWPGAPDLSKTTPINDSILGALRELASKCVA